MHPVELLYKSSRMVLRLLESPQKKGFTMFEKKNVYFGNLVKDLEDFKDEQNKRQEEALKKALEYVNYHSEFFCEKCFKTTPTLHLENKVKCTNCSEEITLYKIDIPELGIPRYASFEDAFVVLIVGHNIISSYNDQGGQVVVAGNWFYLDDLIDSIEETYKNTSKLH